MTDHDRTSPDSYPQGLTPEEAGAPVRDHSLDPAEAAVSDRLRQALQPTDADHDTSAALVQDMLRAGARPRPRWLLAAGGAAAALLLVAGAGVASWVVGPRTPRPSPSTSAADRPADGTDRRLDGTTDVDLLPFEQVALPRVAAVRKVPQAPALLYGGSLTIVRARPEDDTILRAARAQAARRAGAVVVLLDGTDATGAARVRERLGAVPFFDVLPADAALLDALGALPGEFTSRVPSLVRLSSFHTLTRIASGEAAVGRALQPPPPVQTVTIRCTADGPVLDRRHVDAAADGVHVAAVTETGRATTASVRRNGLRFEIAASSGAGTGLGGSGVLTVPPGDAVVSCGEGDGPTAMLSVEDPERFWRGGPESVPGCTPGGIVAAEGPSYGRTPREAVSSWPAVPGPSGQGAPSPGPRGGSDVVPAPFGYVEAPTQYWLVRQNGRGDTVLSVGRTDIGGGFEARAEWVCAPGTGTAPTPR
ncbi:hypothetical protein [Mobilicoccus pelagius]|uniref:Uncharacterized protein n=1 Tax=Mobilicoccus pelagius NBRC 104925 TaxID=1089455 RepID=H5UUP7_9MICO|nr:hypothetical protein [Mobilicoccus pelagius]GAB49455.1 hypothetical protein MOPEL_130_00620 [Mobilicoccus pelagius NBRC 104925]